MTFYALPVKKMTAPCVLFTSCSSFCSENVIKEILKVDLLPEGKAVIEDIVSYDWSINTKYYTADVKLCQTKKRTIGDKTFADSVHAFVVLFDAELKETFEHVKLWDVYLKEIDPEIKILVCDRCSDNSVVNRLAAQTWCIEHGFELVELNPEVESDSETEDDFKETTGIARIVQSLHAHTWPNLELKENQQVVSPFMRQLMKEEHLAKQCDTDNQLNEENQSAERISEKKSESECVQNGLVSESQDLTKNENENQSVISNNIKELSLDDKDCDNCDTSLNKGLSQNDKGQEGACGDKVGGEKTDKEEKGKNNKQQTKEERLDSLLPAEDLALFESLGAEDPGGESFEKMFEQFAHMKEKANGLPPEERKKYAEKIAIAFWRAMGGDEDEIGDLDSDG